MHVWAIDSSRPRELFQPSFLYGQCCAQGYEVIKMMRKQRRLIEKTMEASEAEASHRETYEACRQLRSLSCSI